MFNHHEVSIEFGITDGFYPQVDSINGSIQFE